MTFVQVSTSHFQVIRNIMHMGEVVAVWYSSSSSNHNLIGDHSFDIKFGLK